jgi:hypothetical protein
MMLISKWEGRRRSRSFESERNKKESPEKRVEKEQESQSMTKKETEMVAVSWTEGVTTCVSPSENKEQELPSPQKFLSNFRDAASESLCNAYL